MWLCSRCHTENQDNQAICQGCGAARSAGRFAASAPEGVRAPRVTGASLQPHAEARRPAPAYQPPATDMPPARPPRRPLMALARLTGGLLCLLLPLTVLLLAIMQFDVLSPALVSLFLGADTAKGWQMLCYGLLTLLALLLSLLPGLWTLLLCAPRPAHHRRVRK